MFRHNSPDGGACMDNVHTCTTDEYYRDGKSSPEFTTTKKNLNNQVFDGIVWTIKQANPDTIIGRKFLHFWQENCPVIGSEMVILEYFETRFSA